MGSDKQKVLIVDDVPENIQVLMETLKEDYSIIAATSGQKAIALASTDPAPDIILLDIMMPEMDGYEVCARLKAQKKTAKIPIIFVTAMDDVEDEAKGFDIGAVDYITKPVSPPIVSARVKTHLGLKNAQQKLQDLLNQTLSGSVRVMIDILSLARPAAFSRSSRIKHLVKEMAVIIGLKDIWKFELSALLSQIGCVTVPGEILNKVYSGSELTREEQDIYAGYAARSAELIAHIPNLESVAGIISGFQDVSGGHDELDPADRDVILIGGQLLKTAIDYIQLIGPGTAPETAVHKMTARKDVYDPVLVETLVEVLGIDAPEPAEETLDVAQIQPGMILNQDVYTKDGMLLAVKDTELSPATVKILQQYDEMDALSGPFSVFGSQD